MRDRFNAKNTFVRVHLELPARAKFQKSFGDVHKLIFGIGTVRQVVKIVAKAKRSQHRVVFERLLKHFLSVSACILEAHWQPRIHKRSLIAGEPCEITTALLKLDLPIVRRHVDGTKYVLVSQPFMLRFGIRHDELLFDGGVVENCIVYDEPELAWHMRPLN